MISDFHWGFSVKIVFVEKEVKHAQPPASIYADTLSVHVEFLCLWYQLFQAQQNFNHCKCFTNIYSWILGINMTIWINNASLTH